MKTTSKANSSGIIGIYLNFSSNQYSKRLVWRTNLPKGKTRAYSIRKYGLIGALKKVLADRASHYPEEQLNHVLNFNYVVSYCKQKGLSIESAWLLELGKRTPDNLYDITDKENVK